MKNTKKMALLALIISGSANAAFDGSLQPNQTSGSLEVTTLIEPTIAIKNVNDVDFGTYSPGINITSSDNIQKRETICVYTNAASFDLVLTSSNGSSGDFEMRGDTNNDPLPYTVEIMGILHDGESGFYDGTISQINSGSSYGPYYYHDTYNNDACRDSTSGSTIENIEITFKAKGSDIVLMEPDGYTDVVTITAMAEQASLPAPQ